MPRLRSLGERDLPSAIDADSGAFVFSSLPTLVTQQLEDAGLNIKSVFPPGLVVEKDSCAFACELPHAVAKSGVSRRRSTIFDPASSFAAGRALITCWEK